MLILDFFLLILVNSVENKYPPFKYFFQICSVAAQALIRSLIVLVLPSPAEKVESPKATGMRPKIPHSSVSSEKE